MNDFIPLMNFLNYKNKKNLGLNLIEALINDADKEIKIIDEEKIKLSISDISP